MKKVSIVGGGGHVGATAGLYLAERGICDVLLVDIVEGVPMGKALASARQAAPEKRRELATWLLRALGRLNVLSRHRVAGEAPLSLPGADEAARRAEQLLEALRGSVPTQE